ncbi:three component ABC system middle component [Humidesulfovibrio sp.]|uniref:three component ABC system middle component n=1 Tax=Humidesulfovibrio sp. TaxID=2910988 RepID=UPI003523758F
MNSKHGLEVDLVQNKALGAFLMFRTVQSYEKKSKSNSGCPLLLLFLVIPDPLSERHKNCFKIYAGQFRNKEVLE